MGDDYLIYLFIFSVNIFIIAIMSDACSDTTQENQLKHGPNPFIPMLQR